jgi:hypothetical protein
MDIFFVLFRLGVSKWGTFIEQANQHPWLSQDVVANYHHQYLHFNATKINL